MRRGGGRDHARVALEEIGVVLGAMLRRALADKLARGARAAEGSGFEGRRSGDDGGASGDPGQARLNRQGDEQ